MPDVPASRKWWVCGLLLLATALNYMDRLTLNQSAKRLMERFAFDEAGYGDLEAYFGIAFAVGAITAGVTVDRVGVKYVYPAMVVLWSLAGLATAFARTYAELMACRVFLGFFEAANYPCALTATRLLLTPAERPMGNGVLQSGAALGAMLTPGVMFLSFQVADDWRPAFVAVGLCGLVWAGMWFVGVAGLDLRPAPRAADPPGSSMADILLDRRYWVLAVLVVAMNMTWHFFRAWTPLFLQKGLGYSENAMIGFSAAYYVVADVGSIGVGALSLALVARGWGVHDTRVAMFGLCAGLCLLSIPVSMLPAGPLLLGLMLLVGFGSLGLFPTYYSLSQELTARHQGKVTGSLGTICWVAMFVLHKVVGEQVKRTQSYTEAVALAGVPPLVGWLVLYSLWRAPAKAAAGQTAGAEVVKV